MIEQFVIGTILILLTVLIHAVCLERIIRLLDVISPFCFRKMHPIWKQAVLSFTALSVFGVHIIQIWLWAFFYLAVSALPDFEEALYFSTSSFTTVGYGDIYLDKDWRLLSSFQSANGFLLFGWSTAFIFEVMSKIYEGEHIEKVKRQSAKK